MATNDRTDDITAERPGLVSMAWLLLGSREAAEDAVQEAIARTITRPRADIENLGAYLRGAVVNECRSELRRRQRRGTATLSDDLVHPSGLDAHDIDLLSVVWTLSERRRTAVVLRYYAGMAVNDVAHQMDCRPSTVSSLLHRAMNDLRRALDA